MLEDRIPIYTHVFMDTDSHGVTFMVNTDGHYLLSVILDHCEVESAGVYTGNPVDIAECDHVMLLAANQCLVDGDGWSGIQAASGSNGEMPDCDA
jgi:hypothetical protein